MTATSYTWWIDAFEIVVIRQVKLFHNLFWWWWIITLWAMQKYTVCRVFWNTTPCNFVNAGNRFLRNFGIYLANYMTSDRITRRCALRFTWELSRQQRASRSRSSTDFWWASAIPVAHLRQSACFRDGNIDMVSNTGHSVVFRVTYCTLLGFLTKRNKGTHLKTSIRRPPVF